MVASSLTNILARIRIYGGISEVVVVSFRKLLLSSFVKFILHLSNLLLVKLHIRWLKGRSFHKDEISIVNESSQ